MSPRLVWTWPCVQAPKLAAHARRDARCTKPRVLRGQYTDLGYHVVKLTHPMFGVTDVGVHQMVLARQRRSEGIHVASRPPASSGSRNALVAIVTSSSVAQRRPSSRANAA